MSTVTFHCVSIWMLSWLRSLWLMLWLSFALFSTQIKAQSGPTCNCDEYIYLNEPNIGGVLKFKVNTSIALTEVVGANGGTPPNQHWVPGNNPRELQSPHGIGTDLNGRYYIAYSPGGPFYRYNSDGVRETSFSMTALGQTTNFFTIGNILYGTGAISGNGGIYAYNTCTGQQVGNQVCLQNIHPNGLWGLSYNPTTQMVYAADYAGQGVIYAFTRTQLEAAVATGSCITPIITGTNFPVNPGEHLIQGSNIWGVTGDNDKNIYVVSAGSVWKYDATGAFVTRLVFNTVTTKMNNPAAIVYSQKTGRLYVSNGNDSPTEDCISVVDPVTMTYLGTGVPNPATAENNTPKAMGIVTECCPVNLPSSFTANVCGGVGQKFYLNEEAFKACNGVVSGSSWTPVGTPQGMTFDPCDNSVTITGIGCATFTLNIGAITSTGCAAQTSTFTICNVAPPAIQGVFTKTPATCAGLSDNNNGIITLSSINSIYTKFRIKTGTGAWSGDTTFATASSIGTLPKDLVTNGPNAGATYTVRFYNSDACYRDTTVTIAAKSCTCTNPVVTVSPKTQKVCEGGTIAAFVANSTTSGLTYQWYGPLADTTGSLGTAIVGQTNASFTPTTTSIGKHYFAVVGTAAASCSGKAYVSLEISAKPTLSVTSTNCNVNGLTFDVATSTNGTLTADKGTVSGSTVTGVPAGQTVTITASLNGCTATATAAKTCAIPCSVPNCSTQVTVQKN